MKYTIEDLNNYSNKTVMHIETREQYDILKKQCSNIKDYDSRYKYYLTSVKGYSIDKKAYQYGYNIIEFNDIFGDKIIENFQIY